MLYWLLQTESLRCIREWCDESEVRESGAGAGLVRVWCLSHRDQYHPIDNEVNMHTRSATRLSTPSSNSKLSTHPQVSLQQLVHNTQQHYQLGTVFLLQPGGEMGDRIRPSSISRGFEANHGGTQCFLHVFTNTPMLTIGLTMCRSHGD